MKKILLSKKPSFLGLYFILILLISCDLSYSQEFTDSNLPIVVITTDNNPNTNQPFEILDDPRVLGSMKIIKRPDGTRNYLTDINTAIFLNYNGRINIEIRGSSSQSLEKKPYGFTTLQDDNSSNNNVSLLEMPNENDWVLNGLAFDPSLIRDYISYNISGQMGNYSPRTAFCEVVVNGNYVGLYLLQEKVKADSNRVNILKITPSDTTTPNLTGGYITKSDKITGGDPVAWTMSSYVGETDFIHDLPKPEEVTVQQNNYINLEFNKLATTSHANNVNIITGYPATIDVPSFVDFMLSNELASNADGYQLSTYFHKDRNGKMRAGPIWDFNLTYGNDLFQYGLDRSHFDVWQFSNGDNEGAKFWRDLFTNTKFKCYLSRRWNQLIQTGQPMNTLSLNMLIDQTVAYIDEARERENQRWGTIPNHALEIQNLKLFISLRTTWITNNIGSFSTCSNIVLPQLVINKIDYNPTPSGSFPVSADQEFIEIKNIGTTSVNLTGIYFRELGITYQFPANSNVAGNQSIFIASNPAVFLAKFGLTAFGKFTRNLSNKSQKLVLSDAFGNIIDFVQYTDSSPWPVEADGNGSYLQLINTSLDNSLASSWTSSTSTSLSLTDFTTQKEVKIYPNPVKSKITIDSKKNINSIEILDVFGKTLKKQIINSFETEVDCSTYYAGFYFVKIHTEDGSIIEKIVKQ